MKELILKKCSKCGALVKVIEDCSCLDCGIMCCGEKMEEVIANSTDASVEKHVPTYEVDGDNIKITVNHVMDSDHYIEFILVKMENENHELLLQPGKTPEMIVPYEAGAIIYSYCNKHGLWKAEVK